MTRLSKASGSRFVTILLLAGLFVLAVAVLTIGTSTARSQALPEQGLTSPYVSEPVAPADTRGMPPAGPPVPVASGEQATLPLGMPPRSEQLVDAVEESDPVLQTSPGIASMPAPIMNLEGIAAVNVGNVFPPDTDGQVGPDHYVQMVNASGVGSRVRIWDKATGTQLYDFGMNDLWPIGSRCNTYGWGDPVVVYDQMAGRWLLTHFTNPPSGPYNECIAVSKTGVPTNNPSDWWLYTFDVHNTKFNDYPKIGVWPDGYYMSANQFTSIWAGAGVWVFERDKMLTGASARLQYFDLWNLNPNYGSLLPSNLMGDTLPPSGAPNYFMSVDMNWSGMNDIMHIFEFQTDWNTPANSSFALVQDMVVAPFDWNFSGLSGAEVPQPGTSQGLDNLADRLMMHLWYRNYGDHESLVVNHTVDAGTDHHAIRWYEIQGGAVDTTLADASMYQQGTFAPDSLQRWMGSIAMDHVGNMAVGYSVSSNAVYPSIRYAGRLATDPLGTLPQTESEIIAGSGSQTGSDSYGRGRWGDYSAMSVDPVDDCTFWYTQEYVETTGTRNWQTRVASFKFPNCQIVPALSVAKTPSAERIEAGDLLTFTLVIDNAGGDATGVTISDTVPANTTFAWASDGGALIGGDVLWSGLTLLNGGTDSVSFAVTADCVLSGTQVLNDDYVVYATEWLTPTQGAPVAITIVQEGIVADFSFPTFVAIDWPVPFTNLSQHATAYEWSFGDGGTSTEVNPSYAYTGPTGDYTVELTASNVCTLSTVSHVLTVQDFDVSAGPSAQSAEAIPGELVTYTLWVTNDGTTEDTLQVVVLDQDWPMEFSANQVTLASAEEAPLLVTVTVPIAVDGGEQDAVTVDFRSLSDPRSPAASAGVELTTTAGTLYGVELEPATASLTVWAGETVTYTLWVRNTSNRVDTIDLERVAPGWPTTVLPSSITIARNGLRSVEIAVTMPTGHGVIPEDVAVIRATGSGSYAESTLTTEGRWHIHLPLIMRETP